MKSRILFGLLIISFSVNCFAQEITKIEILSVPMSTETASPINCSNFETSFSRNIVKTTSLTNKSSIRNLMQILDNLPSATSNAFPIPDTRIKIKTYSGQFLMSEICVGEFSVLKDSKVFQYSNALMKELDRKDTPEIQQLAQETKSTTPFSFETAKQYKGYLGAAMGIISFDNNNNFLYVIEGSILNERLTGKFDIDRDTINCIVHTSENQLFEYGDNLKFMIKADSLFQFNSEKKPDMERPLLRIR